MNLNVTPKAEQFMLRMVRFGGGGAEAGFRLVVSPGGCSGLSSEFSVEAAKDGDKLMELEGVKLFLSAESALLLDGYTIDFADTMMETGLKFHNPNARGVCGCGSSTPGNTDPSTATVSLASIGRR